ncbi:MAG: transporter substrate-binding domain-containing protein [Ruminococcaceae bacterium]|nr:transporter substrate-binding domain-containing protein [Oscillospiraceae bacterium]
MKKIISIILAAAMICSAAILFSSCSKNDALVCGVTIFEKMNEKDANGNWTGFESEFAMEVGKIIGMDVEFQEIDWTQKYIELEAGTIDCIWNGFTANSTDKIEGVDTKRSDLVDFTYGYMLNQQCVVIKADNADTIKTEADLAGKTAGVEGGSAGESYASGVIGENGKLEKYSAQNKAFIEVKSGAVDFAVMDIVLAKNVCGQGDYADLMIVEDIVLESEVYAIGFKKGSDLTAKVNDAIKTLFENGKIAELAKKYGFENVVQLVEDIEF